MSFVETELISPLYFLCHEFFLYACDYVEYESMLQNFGGTHDCVNTSEPEHYGDGHANILVEI